MPNFPFNSALMPISSLPHSNHHLLPPIGYGIRRSPPFLPLLVPVLYVPHCSASSTSNSRHFSPAQFYHLISCHCFLLLPSFPYPIQPFASPSIGPFPPSPPSSFSALDIMPWMALWPLPSLSVLSFAPTVYDRLLPCGMMMARQKWSVC